MPSAICRIADCITGKLLGPRDKRADMERVLVATRIHQENASIPPQLDGIVDFVQHCLTFASKVLICINFGSLEATGSFGDRLLEVFRQCDRLDKVIILPLVYWGRFTTALNAIVVKAMEEGYEKLIFQSLEFKISQKSVGILMEMINSDPNVLVVGPALPGHEFTEGYTDIRGRTCPWNTFAIWNMKYLPIIGFPIVSDGIDSKANGGVEEVAAVNTLQMIFSHLKALLVKIHEFEWKVDFIDEERKQYHLQKMNSKDERPNSQMKILSIPNGKVCHVTVD